VHTNFAVSTVAVAPSPAASGTSTTVASGEGARFPAAPFNATIAPISAQPTPANAEIVRVTARTGDVLTLTRAQEGTTARAVQVGDLLAATITVKTLTDIELAANPPRYSASVFNSTNQPISNNTVTYINFDSENYDVGNLHSPVTDNMLLLAPVAGLWLITSMIMWSGNSAGSVRQGRLLKNGFEIYRHHVPPNIWPMQHLFNVLASLNAGDIIGLQVYQDSGVTLTLDATNTVHSMVRLY
jgi:hypothetical protein